MDNCMAPGGAFRTSFLDRGLVTFAECVEHYQGFEPDALLGEMRLLLTAPMLAIPFGVSSARYYALMGALMRCAGTDRSLSEAQRVQLVRICIDIGTFLRGRATDKRAEAFQAALKTALDAVRAAAVRPGIAQEIASGVIPPEAAETPATGPQDMPDDIRALDFADPPPGLRSRISA